MDKKTSGYYRDECNRVAWLNDNVASLIGDIFGGEKRLRRKILRYADMIQRGIGSEIMEAGVKLRIIKKEGILYGAGQILLLEKEERS